MYDRDGDRPDVNGGIGRETQEQVEASLAAMSEANYYNYQHRNNPVHKVMDPVANATGSQSGGAIAGIGDSVIGAGVEKQFNRFLFKPKTFSKAKDYGLGKLFLASKVTKVAGALGMATLGIGIWDNFAHYTNRSAKGRTLVDVGVFVGGVAVGALMSVYGTPVIFATVAGLAVGAIASEVGNRLKNAFYNEKKYY